MRNDQLLPASDRVSSQADIDADDRHAEAFDYATDPRHNGEDERRKMFDEVPYPKKGER